MKRNNTHLTSRGTRLLRIMTACLVVSLMLAFLPLPGTYGQVEAASGVKIGQAVRGENGSKNNKPGDKTGREVYISDWEYSMFRISMYNWKYVLRPKDHELARKIAANMKAACNNNKIGYDQVYPDRTSFYDEAKKNDWDIAGITKKCETTCTNAISVCLNAEGVKVPKNWMSGDVYDDLMATDQFVAFSDKEYVASADKLLPGDILVNPDRHTAMVVESPNPFTYKLTYRSLNGKNNTLEIEEKKKINLNLNNGDKIKVLTMNKDRSLASSEPERDGAEFIGWEKTGARAFSAQYIVAQPAIATSNDRETIEEEQK